MKVVAIMGLRVDAAHKFSVKTGKEELSHSSPCWVPGLSVRANVGTTACCPGANANSGIVGSHVIIWPDTELAPLVV